MDYNAPMLTLTAMHVMNDTNDPFFTSLQAGAYEKVRPQGLPCDAAFPQACVRELSRGGKIAMGVTLTVVGVAIIGLLSYYFWLLATRKTA